MTAIAGETSDQQQQLACPLCDYDLRGLIDPRCPECGYAFTWDELRDPTRRLHPYLFEHHAERNVWSFRKTLVGSMRPRRFWATLFPTQPSFPRRLVIYALFLAVIAAAPLLVAAPYRIYQTNQDIRAHRTAFLRSATLPHKAQLAAQYGSVQAYVDQTLPLFPSRHSWGLRSIAGWWRLGGHVQVTGFALLWPWMTFLSLMIFRTSMRRARVRPVHVLRCVIYSADAAALLAAAVTATWFFYDPNYGMSWPDDWFGSRHGAVSVIAVLLVILTYRLAVAYRRYLRFDHPLATAIASQAMIALLTLKFLADFYAEVGW